MRRFLLPCLVCLSLPAAAGVTVTFPEAGPTDAGQTRLETQRATSDIARHLEALGARHLKPGQNLRIEVLDLNLGGRVKPQPGSDARVARAGEWPQIRVRYELEIPGEPVRKGEEVISDREYLRGPNNDWSALGREKRMLEEWFRARFVRSPSG